jgi:exosome complex component RRP46|eukprot:scaffold520_cov271-Chaetoceros_neogracile.AAC.19
MVEAAPKNLRRSDGRTGGGSLRPLAAEVSCLKRADGSAKFSSGSTQILAAVYGPAAPRIPSRERTNEASVGVVFKFGTKAASTSADNTSNTHPGYGANERELERFIGDSLMACIAIDQYPRTVIEVVIQVIKVDGSLVATALNAATLALLDAGIQMKSLPIATTCLVPTNGDVTTEFRFDPTAEEESSDEYSAIVVATDSVRDGVIASMTFGSFQLDSFLSCVEGAKRASKAVVAFMRIAMEQKVNREAKTLWST